MASSKTTETVQVAFQQVAGQQMDTSALVSELDQLRSASQTQVDALGTNTDAVAQNTSSRSTGGTAQTVASTLGKTALSMIPLVGLFSSLFGGGSDDTTTQAAPVKYALPPSLQIDGTTAAVTATSQSATPPVAYTSQSVPAAATPAAPQATAASTAAPQVTIQVQAMDSQSFMDHSQEIADAVRMAMLNNHPLNDVVSEL